MATQNEILERAFRAIDALLGTPAGAEKSRGPSQEIESASRQGASSPGVFPHCSRCASYALYRRNNIGTYECMTCGLQGIEESTARRVQ